MKIKYICLLLTLTLLCLFTVTAYANEDDWYVETVESKSSPEGGIHGSVDMNYTMDTRDMNRFTLNTLLFLPYGFSYSNFFHLNSQMAVGGGNFDVNDLYHEQNLWWAPYKPIPLDVATQLQFISGVNNDQVRFGLRWRISDTPWIKVLCEKIHLFASVQYHPLQTDFNSSPGWGQSLEYVYRMQIMPQMFNDRLYIGGFVDHNLDFGTPAAGNNHNIVAETQLGFRAYGNLNAIIEYRYSDYDVKRQGIAFGAEYVVNF